MHTEKNSIFFDETKTYDLIVVGAGPTGSMAAKYALKNGVKNVLIIEEHSSIGSPVQCAGIISTSAYEESEIGYGADSDLCILEKFKGAFVYSPSGNILSFEGKETMAYSISRKIFDRKIAESAASLGAKFKLKTKCLGVERKNGLMEIKVNEAGTLKTFYSKIVIAADGFKSAVAKSYGLSVSSKLLSGYQIELSGMKNVPGYVQIFIGSVAPGFFGWSVPISSTQSRVGLAFDTDSENYVSWKNASGYMEELVKKVSGNEDINLSQMSINFGVIPLGYMKKTYGSGFMVVGDAAGHCKPFSGGGIKLGLQAAKIAGKVAAQAISENNFSESFMEKYEKEWKSEFGKEIDIGMRIHNIRNGLSDDDLDSFIEILDKPEICEMISNYGDIDKPSILFKKFLLSKHSYKMLKLIPLRRLLS